MMIWSGANNNNPHRLIVRVILIILTSSVPASTTLGKASSSQPSCHKPEWKCVVNIFNTRNCICCSLLCIYKLKHLCFWNCKWDLAKELWIINDYLLKFHLFICMCTHVFSPSTMWVPRVQLRWPGFVSSTISCWVIFPNQWLLFLKYMVNY